MADSDDDYERRDRGRGRDKFRRERSDYDAGRGRREDWPDDNRAGAGGGWGQPNRERGGRRDNYGRDYGGRPRDRYSPGDRSDDPPMKRMRRDWDDRGGYGGGYGDGYGGGGHGGGWGPGDSPYGAPFHPPGNQGGNQPREGGGDNFPTQPPIMSFKHFLAGLDDSVAETDAVSKYNDYKMNFKKDQIFDFWQKHNNEEWFRSKYHPDECDKGKEQKSTAINLRLKVFNDLLESGWIDDLSIDVEKNLQIIRLLDAAVIKLEGGTDLDLQSLDIDYHEEPDKQPEPALSLFNVDADKPAAKEGEASPSKRKESVDSIKQENQEANGETDAAVKSLDNTIDDADAASKSEDTNGDVNPEIKPELSEVGEAGDQAAAEVDMKNGEEIKKGEQEADESVEKKPRHLHKTASIFLRNIAPSVSRKEIEDECKKIKGYMRLALADPQPERRFYRRGWVTFERTVNIRDICWNFNAIKFGGVETGAIVNRDLSRRIRSVNGIASHKNVIRADIRHAAKIVFNLDQQRKLWMDESVAADEPVELNKRPAFGFQSKNPLLRNITDYLIEEASAEEEELLGGEVGEIEEGETDANATGTGQSLERDEALIKVLDRLLLYLRIVHSIDYYNHSDYPQEDEMPNRIGIMHARGSPPSSKITNTEVNEYIKQFETKIQAYLKPMPTIVDDEMAKLGKQDPEVEVNKFIDKNTEYLSPGKYFCPLSKKKFKGPEFVKKHIENKFAENLDAIRKDAAYFNNYLADPKRPQLPEHPSNRPQQPQAPRDSAVAAGPPGGGPWPPHPAPYGPGPYGMYGPPRGPPMGGYPGPMAWHGPGRGGYPVPGVFGIRGNKGGRGRNYRDWDKPDEED